jgi:hypothetical protein
MFFKYCLDFTTNLEREGIDFSTVPKSPYAFAEILCMYHSTKRVSYLNNSNVLIILHQSSRCYIITVEHLSPPYLNQPLLTHQLYDAFVTLIQIRDHDMKLRYMSQLLEGTNSFIFEKKHAC